MKKINTSKISDKNGKFTGEKTIIPKRIEPKAQEEESSTNN